MRLQHMLPVQVGKMSGTPWIEKTPWGRLIPLSPMFVIIELRDMEGAVPALCSPGLRRACLLNEFFGREGGAECR
jgi:hypothetical protein